MTVQLYDASYMDNGKTLSERLERKYYVAPAKIGLAYGLLRQVCTAASEFPSEQINSLYFDTTDFEQHERSSSGDFRKDKVRIRWYGDKKDLNAMQTAFIELKSRNGFTGTKQRLEIQAPAENFTLENLKNGVVPGTMLMSALARFDYFPSKMLRPAIKISYWRYRFNEVMTGQQVSLDCYIRSTMIMPGAGNGEKELELPGGVIEIKGLTMELPPTLKRARILDTDWTRFSKYSICIDGHYEAAGSIGRLSPSGRIIRL